jgi:hypothetical protein
MISVADYLRAREPTRPGRKDYRGWRNFDEERFQRRRRIWLALRDSLLAAGPDATLRRAAIATTAAAARHGADLVVVWRRVLRFRELTRNKPEQLRLPLDAEVH